MANSGGVDGYLPLENLLQNPASVESWVTVDGSLDPRKLKLTLETGETVPVDDVPTSL